MITISSFFKKPDLRVFAKTVLPKSFFDRFAASTVAKRLARGSMWGLLGSAASRILVLLAMIIVARILGKVSFGEFGVIQATLGVAGLMAGIGLGNTGTRFVAQHASTNPEQAGRIIGLVRGVSWIAILLFAGIIVLTSSEIADSILGAPHLHTALSWGVWLMATNVLRGVQTGVISGFERFDLVAKLNILEGIVSIVAMVIMARTYGVVGVLLGMALGGITAWLAGHYCLRTELRKRNIDVRYRGAFKDWRILSGYSLPSLMANLVATPVLWFCMTLVARSPNGYAEMGIYNAAYQWHGPMIFIPMILMSTSIPLLVQEWESGNIKRFRTVTLWLGALTLIIAVPPVLLISTLSPWVMSFYGQGFSDGWLILVLLLAAAPFHALTNISTGALLCMNQTWRVFGLNVVWGITMLFMTFFLVPTLSIIGLALAFLSAYAAQAISAVSLVLLGSRIQTIE
ncbi:MAG: oligosaccharide flippase family protein [Hydrogenophilales bacterium]|nr:oligosaccharide flippase family protein [Hydrogenophilales bacterium]